MPLPGMNVDCESNQIEASYLMAMESFIEITRNCINENELISMDLIKRNLDKCIQAKLKGLSRIENRRKCSSRNTHTLKRDVFLERLSDKDVDNNRVAKQNNINTSHVHSGFTTNGLRENKELLSNPFMTPYFSNKAILEKRFYNCVKIPQKRFIEICHVMFGDINLKSCIIPVSATDQLNNSCSKINAFSRKEKIKEDPLLVFCGEQSKHASENVRYSKSDNKIVETTTIDPKSLAFRLIGADESGYVYNYETKNANVEHAITAKSPNNYIQKFPKFGEKKTVNEIKSGFTHTTNKKVIIKYAKCINYAEAVKRTVHETPRYHIVFEEDAFPNQRCEKTILKIGKIGAMRTSCDMNKKIVYKEGFNAVNVKQTGWNTSLPWTITFGVSFITMLLILLFAVYLLQTNFICSGKLFFNEFDAHMFIIQVKHYEPSPM